MGILAEGLCGFLHVFHEIWGPTQILTTPLLVRKGLWNPEFSAFSSYAPLCVQALPCVRSSLYPWLLVWLRGHTRTAGSQEGLCATWHTQENPDLGWWALMLREMFVKVRVSLHGYWNMNPGIT